MDFSDSTPDCFPFRSCDLPLGKILKAKYAIKRNPERTQHNCNQNKVSATRSQRLVCMSLTSLMTKKKCWTSLDQKRAEVIRLSPPPMSPRTTRRDTRNFCGFRPQLLRRTTVCGTVVFVSPIRPL